MSAFDPQEFLSSPQSASFDTRFPLHKAGDWDGYIGAGEKDIDIRTFDSTNKETGQPVTYTVMEVAIYTEDPKALGDGATPPARCRLSIFLDIAPDGKSLDLSTGKNRGLGYLLTATGHQDKTGKQIKPWSKTSLAGQRVKYRVAHSPNKKTGELQADVTQVASPA
jgi:hypothetical protein